jgi:hypothetical protein
MMGLYAINMIQPPIVLESAFLYQNIHNMLYLLAITYSTPLAQKPKKYIESLKHSACLRGNRLDPR